MSTTLMSYAEHLYPGHATNVWKGEDPPLAEHTVVMQVVGQWATESAISVLEHRVGEERVAAVLVRAETSTAGDRPRFGREQMSTVAAGAAVGIGTALVVALIVLPGVFAFLGMMLLGGVLGAGVAALFALRRRVAMGSVPASRADIGFVAALIDDGAVATELALTLEREGLYDVQIVHPE